uniref:Uncharacterized protein n=1 Tax=Panagrolaimus sp. PS1159 TaxID=55785 RepID=A0AC35GAN0_9BILA
MESSADDVDPTLSEQLIAIMNGPSTSQKFENSPPPSYEPNEESPLFQLLHGLFTNNNGSPIQLTLDAFNKSCNPQIEFPSNPLNDISTVVGKELSNEEIIEFLKNPWRPSSTYEFPFDESKKRARYTWFKTYPFCTFSYIHDGIYCIPCALRSVTRYPKNGRPVQLITEPLKRFDNFSKKIRNHTETLYHRENMDYIDKLSPGWMNPKVICVQSEPFKDEIAQ